jgi:tellurite resistance protein
MYAWHARKKGKFDMPNAIKEMERERKNRLIEKYNHRLRKLSQRLAFQIFILVADADGEIDSKEITGFKTFLNDRAEVCTNPFTQRIFHLTLVNYSILTDRFQKKTLQKSMDELQQTMKLIEKCVSSRLMASICNDLKSLATAVARASGGFLGVGSPVSAEEEKVLQELSEVFEESVKNAHGPNDVDPDTFLIIRSV